MRVLKRTEMCIRVWMIKQMLREDKALSADV